MILCMLSHAVSGRRAWEVPGCHRLGKSLTYFCEMLTRAGVYTKNNAARSYEHNDNSPNGPPSLKKHITKY